MQARLPILVALPRLATETLVGQFASTSPRPIVQDPGLRTREVFPTLTAEATLVPRRSARSAPRSQTATIAGSVGGGTLAPCFLVGRPTFKVCRYKAAYRPLPAAQRRGTLQSYGWCGNPDPALRDQGRGGHRDSPQELAPPAPIPTRDRRLPWRECCQVRSARRRRMA
jgi:hypothetical protein